MQIRQHAKGRWPEIISALLGEQFANTRKHQPCPTGDGEDRFRFSDKTGCGNYFCACSDGSKDGFDLLKCVKGWEFATAAKHVESVIGECPKDGEEVKPKQESWASKLRREVIKTKRSNYLEGRGLEVPPILDWHKSLPYYDEDGNRAGNYPAMLAPVMRGNRFLTYHVTYLDGGKKADIDHPRKVFPGAHLIGAAVPLYEPNTVLGVAEGIETAIASHLIFGTPVWAVLNTSLLKNWMPPEGVESVVIFGDNDENYAGQAAAYTLAHKLRCKGYSVTLQFPPVGMDFNDVLLNQKESA